MRTATRIETLLAALLVCLASTGSDAAGEGADLSVVPLAKAAPAVDGDLGDAVWKQALLAKLDGFCDRARRMKGLKPKDATEALLLADKDKGMRTTAERAIEKLTSE